jgi:hypothetical protein
MNYSITFTSSQFNIIKDHLYPGDNKEAIAFALCGRRAGTDRHRLLVQEIISVPYELCSRTAIQLKWSTELLPKMLETAANQNLSVLKIHSHPNDVDNFSVTDDFSDKTLFKSIYGWTGSDPRHASAILFQNDTFIGRIIHPDGRFQTVNAFRIIGDDVVIQDTYNCLRAISPAGKRVAQTFGAGTYNKLQKMRIAIVGCSGTGGPVVEMLARNGVGGLVLVDPDIVEEKNLNRIPNTFLTDAQNKEFKVTVLKNAVLKMGTGANVLAIPKSIISPQAILAVGECDYIFGCMDGIEGRHILNRLATFYSIPFSDLGVKLIANGKGGIKDICGTVHYLQPGGSSLLSRNLYTTEQLRSESLKRTDTEYYNNLKKEKYIVGGNEESPAVISVNMHVATFAVNDFLARIHPYRNDPNSEFSIQRFSLTNSFQHHEKSTEPCQALKKYVGCGDVTPLLDMPNLSKKEKAA